MELKELNLKVLSSSFVNKMELTLGTLVVEDRMERAARKRKLLIASMNKTAGGLIVIKARSFPRVVFRLFPALAKNVGRLLVLAFESFV